MGAFCRSSGTDDHELPYTTSRALDVKQPDNQQPPSPVKTWWQRLTGRPCGPCHSSSEDEASGDLSSPSPRNPLPPAAQMSRPFLASHLDSGSSGLAASLGGPSVGNAASSTRSRSTAQQQQQLGDLQEVPDVAQKQDVAVVGRLASFSAKATRQLNELRKSLTRSQSFQGTQTTRRDWESVRLFQVLPPALASRAHAWHNELNVKEGWICWDNIYFEAPGTTTAPLSGCSLDVLTSANSCSGLQPGSNSQCPLSTTMASPPPAATAGIPIPGSSLSPPGAYSNGNGDGSSSLQVQHTGGSDCSSTVTQPGGAAPYGHNSGSNPCMYASHAMLPLPPVTMVFMAVEGPEQLVKRRRPFTPVVQGLLNRVVRDALRRLGGYLCRVQEGDMKFMVAFASPVTALEWCLLVQVAAMYLPWPQSAIMLLPSCREQVDSSGRLVFRGPRIKMGVCEGVPQSILPDHEGRADYHGQSINMAARFMDKGARGGQIACTRELAQQAMAVWAAGGGSASFTDLHSPLATTVSIAEGQEHAHAAAATATEADAGVSVRQGGQFGDQSDRQVLQPGVGSSCEGVQALDIELPREQAAAVAVAAAAAGGSSSSSVGGSRPRSWWTAFTSPSAANLAAAAAADGTSAAATGAASTASKPPVPPHSSTARAATAEPAVTGFGSPVEPGTSSAGSAAASASAPLPPSLQLTAASSPGLLQAADSLNSCSSSAPAAGPVGPASYWAAATTSTVSPPGAADGSVFGGSTGCQESRSVPGGTGQPAAAVAAEGQALDVGPQRRTGGSWPGGLSAPTQQQQQQGQGLGWYPRIPAHLWLSRSRSNSQDGSNHLKQGSRSRLSSNHNHGSKGSGSQASHQQQQQQASGMVGIAAGLSSALSKHQLSMGGQQQQQPPPPPVAPSPFVMSDVVRVPFKVEVHRLGLFRFKGGPAQQEMVQVVPTHLLGRAQFIAAETPPQASRKGQLLQRLEGRVGEPVSVQLPALAQDYHEHLNHRVSGITGLPHRCTSPTHTQHPSSPDTTVAAVAPRRAMTPDAAGRWGSRSVSLPAGRVLWSIPGEPPSPESRLRPLHSAAAGVGPPGRVFSELGPALVSTGYDTGRLSVQEDAADGGGVADQLPPTSRVSSTPAGTSSACNATPASQEQQQQQQGGVWSSGVVGGTSKQASHAVQASSAAAAAAAAAGSYVVDVAGLAGLERHDSFRSVGDDGLVVTGSDEEVGLIPATAAAADGREGPRSKSDPQFLRPRSPGTNRQASHG